MAEDRVKRRLVAIMVIDVVGFSRLMSKDETGTLTALKQLRATIIDPVVSQHGGRIVKLMGDGALVEFTSVVDAVECSVTIQRALATLNLDVLDNKSIRLRIGVNLGDIIIEGRDIYGDGVNIAARLESLARPGSVCISGTVFDQVKGKLDAGFVDLGPQNVKNIDEPVRAYLVTMASIKAASDVNPTLPEKPSIAVLPLDNMSGDHEQQYFSDGMSEDLTTALSRFNWLFVAARNSAFGYKGEAIDVKRIGRELGVRYVLEGSVRRIGGRVRVNVQLIDAETLGHVWAERFDREIEDVFELQDDIVARIASTVGPEITLAEIERAQRKRPETFDAWDHYLQAMAAYHRMTRVEIEDAIWHLKKAVEEDPDFANAYALRALCHAHAASRGWDRPARQAYESAYHFAQKSVRLSPTSPEANQALAFVLSVTGRAEEAVTVARRSIELNPNFSDGYAVLGHTLIFCGDLQGGLAACHQAERSNPRDSRGNWLHDAMGHAYFFLGHYEKAIEISRKGIHQDPSLFGALVTLACANAQLGHAEEAKHHIDELLCYIPRFSLSALSKNPMFLDPKLTQKLIDSMRLAGLPD